MKLADLEIFLAILIVSITLSFDIVGLDSFSSSKFKKPMSKDALSDNTKLSWINSGKASAISSKISLSVKYSLVIPCILILSLVRVLGFIYS